MEPVTINLSGGEGLGIIVAHLLAAIVLGLVSRRHALKAGVLLDSSKPNQASSHIAGAIITGVLMFVNAIAVVAMSEESFGGKQVSPEMTVKYEIPQDALASLNEAFQEQTKLFTDQIDRIKSEIATQVLVRHAKEAVNEALEQYAPDQGSHSLEGLRLLNQGEK